MKFELVNERAFHLIPESISDKVHLFHLYSSKIRKGSVGNAIVITKEISSKGSELEDTYYDSVFEDRIAEKDIKNISDYHSNL